LTGQKKKSSTFWQDVKNTRLPSRDHLGGSSVIFPRVSEFACSSLSFALKLNEEKSKHVTLAQQNGCDTEFIFCTLCKVFCTLCKDANERQSKA
jgi:hypothetical protein